MTREQRVLSMLKPKVKAFGFNQKELKGIAAKIANNLTSTEDALDEDVNAEIESQIEAAIPFLQFAQSQSNRVIEEWRKNHSETNEEDENEDEDESSFASKSKVSRKSTHSKDGGNEQMKQLVDMVTRLTQKVDSLEKGKTSDNRRSRLEKLLKDTGTFGSRTLKNFSRMNFESDDEFEDFFEEIREDLNSYNQERANEGLDKLGKAPQTAGAKGKNEVLTDDEIKELANL